MMGPNADQDENQSVKGGATMMIMGSLAVHYSFLGSRAQSTQSTSPWKTVLDRCYYASKHKALISWNINRGSRERRMKRGRKRCTGFQEEKRQIAQPYVGSQDPTGYMLGPPLLMENNSRDSLVGTSEPGIGPTRSKFTQTEATSSDDGIHLAWQLTVGPLACLFYEFEHLVIGNSENKDLIYHAGAWAIIPSQQSSILSTDNFYLIVGRKWLQRKRVGVFAEESYCTIRDLDYPGCLFKFSVYVPKAQKSLQVKACQPDSQVALQQKLESTILPTADDAQVEVHCPLTPTMGRIGGDIRAWDRANQVQVYPDGGDEQRRRHPFGLATYRRATSMDRPGSAGLDGLAEPGPIRRGSGRIGPIRFNS
ncbi:hypothetical protein Taro_024082 [Colocasia esculenta]|uniref:Uncharacterized protein n=1 Tax=Colocasia esculenta TaxID=4460 RepID=A0A843UZB1_COLES|nr:hypothetical protein [Colocasia esculenta]